MDKAELVSSFKERATDSGNRYNRLLAKFPKRKSTVGKHEAQNYIHLENVLEEADKTCPKAADTIRWLLWHDILDAQWYLHMAEMLVIQEEGER
tara:strand:+ start:375 stop:656 length:282 start_codon:yes stop_codon:yes gene_type:complete